MMNVCQKEWEDTELFPNEMSFGKVVENVLRTE